MHDNENEMTSRVIPQQNETNESPIESNTTVITTTESTKTSTGTSTMTPPKPKGILVLITGPVLFYPHDSSIITSLTKASQSNRTWKRIAKSSSSSPSSWNSMEQSFDTNGTEFTLLCFCAAWDKNSLMFIPKLGAFVHQHQTICQCLIVPTDGTTSTNGSNHDRAAHERLCHGMGFMCLPGNHPNRNALFSLLSIYKQPVLVVVRNKDGRVVTQLGREAIDFNPDGAIDAWKQNQSGVSLLSSYCIIS